MPEASHARSAVTAWDRLTLVEQLANVGSEVERTLRAHEQGLTDRGAHALARALDLFDRTAGDARWRGPRRRETLRAREEFCRIVFADAPDRDAAKSLRKYFLQFAVAARHG